MRKKFKGLFVICCLIVSLFAGTINSNAASGTIYLLGIVDPDGYDRTSWMYETDALSNSGSTIVRKTAFTSTNLKSYLNAGRMLVMQTHGESDNVRCVDSSGNIQNLTISSISSLDLSNLEVCYYGACNTGYGGSSAINLVNSTYNKGAQCVVGYTDSVNTYKNSYMLKSFCNYLGYGHSIKNALSYAQSAVLGHNGVYGNINKRLVRGDTSGYIASMTSSESMSANLNNGILNDVTDVDDLKKIMTYNESDFSTVQLEQEFKISGDELYFDNNGDCIGFYKNRENLPVNTLIYSAYNDVETISQNYINELGLLDEYKCGLSEYTNDIDLWSFVYYKYIDEIKTEDFICMTFDSSGNMVSFAMPNKTIFEGTHIDANIINAIKSGDLLSDKIAETYPNINDYDIVDYIIRMDEAGALYVDYSVEILDENANVLLESVFVEL